MWSQGLELVSWLLLLPLMGFMVYASQEERFMDIELQVCMRQEKVSAQTSLIQTLQRWWFPGGAIITFCLSCCIYAATIVHLHRRLKRIGQAPIASELSRTNSVRHDKTMRENILSVPSEMMRKRRLLKHQPEFLSLEDLTSDSMWNERDVRHKSSRRLMLKRHSQNKYSLANHSLDSLPSTASAPSVLGGTGDSNTPRFPVSERRRSSSEVGTSVQSEERFIELLQSANLVNSHLEVDDFRAVRLMEE
ncbi:hypothetical protein CAPTEDRAFT_201863 [Capitella teleta]|uniref:G-protein coupled receptors family 1 profile domain-containing protein n=1 Tax=Capitella teleta TaxID=283909 RepID=R7VK26_CAPTE|nr:hypothetical protein CAPTEDRAFT_201863 [Capitella teleta]|eukprot:ELU16981.1 hypothetical protein CAPTEDRAFT_201863 [Capitella teleta]